MDIGDIRLLETRASRTWPAEVSEPLSGWLLRASDGTTKRANSVLTAGDGPLGGDWLEHIEAFYRERGLAPVFQISDGSPQGIDELLERNGYMKDIPCMVMTAMTAETVHAAGSSMNNRDEVVRLHVSERADSHWLDDFIRLEQFPSLRLPFYRGLCERMPAGTHFFTLRWDGAAIAVATVAGEYGWGGILNVAVDEKLRGQGFGKLLMAKVAEHCLALQIDRLYLQVIANNEPAVRLYERLGFAPAYMYHYRTKLTP